MPRVDRQDILRVYVWQIPVRLTHWVTAAAIVSLSVTGLYIADPFLLPPGGTIMFDVRLVHMVSAFTLVGSIAFRVLWAFVGNRFARWYAFIPTSRNQLTEVFRQAGFYAFIRQHPPKVLGHNQLAAAAYLLLLGLLFLEAVTGFALDGILGTGLWASLFGWLVDILGPQGIRLIHHLTMWAVLAIALFHIYSCLLVDHVERCGLVSSIVTGYKAFPPEDIVESRDGGPELLPDGETAALGPATAPAIDAEHRSMPGIGGGHAEDLR
jgi:Ni/Fe-hydrogenase 1 B-type cytochrome subunit